FVSPPSGDAIMDFVNELGYTEVIHFMSRMAAQIPSSPDALGYNYNPTKKGRKDKPQIIPYFWFTKLIICHLGRIHNIHQRSKSPFHLAEEDLRLGNLKFVPKGKKDEVFGMPILNELISNNTRNTSYYNAYLEMVAKHKRRIATEKEGKKKPTTTKQPKLKPANEKSSKPSPVPKPKATKEKLAKSSPAKPSKMGNVLKTRKGKKVTRPLPVVEGKGKAIATEEQAAQSLLVLHTPKIRTTTDQFILPMWTPATEERSTGPSAQPQDDTSTNIVHESPSPADAETGADSNKTTSEGDTEILQIDEDQGKDVDNQVNLEEKTTKLDQGQAGSNIGKTPESRPPPEQEFMEEDHAGPDPGVSRVALSGPNPKPTHEEFMDNVYPDVHGSLKLPVNEHVILEEPLSSSGTLSSMKDLNDAYTFGDQFLNDKSTEDELDKLNMDSEVVSMVTVPIHLASSSVSSLSTPIIDLSLPKPVPATTHAPIFTATTSTTTTTFLLLPPLPQQSTSDSDLAARVAALEQKLAAFEQKSKTLDNTTQNLRSRSGSYKSLPKHVALYETLEASMKREKRDEFLLEKDKSRKRRRNNQDPLPPLSDSDPSKKRRHDSDSHRMLTDQVDLVNPKGHQIMPDIRKPLPLRGPLGRRPALSISKLKAAHYLDFGLEELVLSLWIKSERKYDISAAYGISHWWFKRKEFYITRHDAPSDHSKIRSHMRILNVISLKTYVRYGYAFLKEIVHRRADYKEYKISEADFKNLYPNDFEDWVTISAIQFARNVWFIFLLVPGSSGGSPSQPFNLLETCGIIFLLVPGSSGGRGKSLPSGFLVWG
nr:hypothetical protein [Tanacetum cinerariifolium]